MYWSQLWNSRTNTDTVMWVVAEQTENISIIYNETTQQFRLCSVCNIYMLISFSIVNLETGI
jgi:chlorite dismutase